MNTQVTPRRGTAERITGAIWGVIVTAVGAFLIAALSGYEVDIELIAIVALAALGGWLLVSAIAAGTRQSRRERAAVGAAAPPESREPASRPASPTESAADAAPEDPKDA